MWMVATFILLGLLGVYGSPLTAWVKWGEGPDWVRQFAGFMAAIAWSLALFFSAMKAMQKWRG